MSYTPNAEDMNPLCPHCRRHVVKIVPLKDNDQSHEGTMWCVKCKRKKRAEDKVKMTAVKK